MVYRKETYNVLIFVGIVGDFGNGDGAAHILAILGLALGVVSRLVL